MYVFFIFHFLCSGKFATFPLAEHGNKKYGVDSASNKRNRTKQGKMEKSFLNFKVFVISFHP